MKPASVRTLKQHTSLVVRNYPFKSTYRKDDLNAVINQVDAELRTKNNLRKGQEKYFLYFTVPM